jgi:signal transduction histidine kinase
MKRPPFICLLLLFLYSHLYSQDQVPGVFHLREIPVGGLILDSGWVYKAGDEADRSQPNYNDNDWVMMNPVNELHHLPEVRKAGIGWFRLKLRVDSSLFNKTFAFVLSGLGASEVYMNGGLLFKFGKVSSNFREEQTRFYTNQLLNITFSNQPVQVLAIRHSFHQKNLYLKFIFERPVAKVNLKRIDQAFADHVRDDNFDATLRSIQVSFYLPLGFLLIFLFISFRLQKEYLFCGVFCFCMFAAILLHIFALSEPTTVTRSNTFLYTTQVLYVLGALSLLNGTYIIYKQKRSWFFYIIMLFGAWCLAFYFISYDWSGLCNACFFPLINLEFLRINWLALRRKRKGAGILFITGLLLNLSLVLYIVFTVTQQLQAGAYLQSISFIIPGIGFSLFFAGEFARNASSLRQRAIEVEDLSRKMLAKEIEKQQLLESQNETLEKQVTERTAALSRSLNDLKETQNQLIQREKMASLGELTAGIAHEIQNPLNFVNNFSEVNKELIAELKAELLAGKTEEAKTIAENIEKNEEKIVFHGKRADAIVKSMLQHSRSSSGKKELTDLNVLVNEYLQLAYHGLRAKDKSLNAKFETDLDLSIEKVNAVPQELGRVILNLVNNAVYAVNEKKRQSNGAYEPTVTVTTRKNHNKVEIKIRDNGNGIPPKVLDKIFHPFYTTKPTGQGTGLGLSLSYDIIKAHGGELNVVTKEGEGSEFIIQLPDHTL